MKQMFRTAPPAVLLLASFFATQTASADTYRLLVLQNPTTFTIAEKKSGRLLIYNKYRDPRKVLELGSNGIASTHLAPGKYFLQFLPEGSGGFDMKLHLSHDTQEHGEIAVLAFHAKVTGVTGKFTVDEDTWEKHILNAKYELHAENTWEGTQNEGSGSTFLKVTFKPKPAAKKTDGAAPPPKVSPGDDGDDVPPPPPYDD